MRRKPFWPTAGLALALALAMAPAAYASGKLEVEILDRDGQPVPEVAVYAVPLGSPAAPTTPQPVAIMDQRDLAFVPHVLVVEVGTRIEFPNSDAVLHHVYSFSPAKRFELPLYSGTVHEPLSFDMPGLVTLGCNIHDDMLGYILVVETPHFATSDRAGLAAVADLPPGDYSVSIWTPRARSLPEPATVHVGSARQTLRFTFDDKLYPPHEHSETSLLWSAY